jgi:hypothetical protein
MMAGSPRVDVIRYLPERRTSPPCCAALALTPKRGGTLRVSYGSEIAPLDFHTAPGHEGRRSP